MKQSSKIPARKTTKPGPKKDASTKGAAPKVDAKPAPTMAKPTTPKPRDARLPAVGTSMVREYKGKNLKVKYLEDGIEVDGKHFESLSAAARHVTGAASINGFLFFGLLQVGGRKAKEAKPTVAPIGNGNDLATPAGQRAALAAAGIAKRGRPITKPRGAKANASSPAKRGKSE